MVDEVIPTHDPRETLRRLCAERGDDFAGLSRLIGRNPAYIQQFVRRGTPKRLPERERRVLARHFGIAERLLGADEVAEAPGGLVVIAPLAGEATPSLPPLAFSAAWLERLTGAPHRQLRLWSVVGDAMAPTLNPGDDLLIDLSDAGERLRDGLYLLDHDGGPQLRRLTLHPVRAEVTVQSDNPAYADWPGLRPDELTVLGRVIWAGRRLA